MFSSIKTWIGTLMGSSSAIDNIVDKDNGLIVRAGTAIGNLHYSDQEKAINSREVQEWSIRMLDSLSQFKVVQRIIAFSVMFSWVFLVVNLVAAGWVYALTAKTVTVTDVDGVITSTTTGINAYDLLFQLATTDFVFWPIVSVLALYTGGGTINSLRNGNKG